MEILGCVILIISAVALIFLMSDYTPFKPKHDT